jgi:hypothetical protein
MSRSNGDMQPILYILEALTKKSIAPQEVWAQVDLAQLLLVSEGATEYFLRELFLQYDVSILLSDRKFDRDDALTIVSEFELFLNIYCLQARDLMLII